MYSWINKKLIVKKKDNYGYGVFADDNIKKGELLTIFGGYVMSVKEESELPLEIRDLAHQIHENFVLGIKSKKEIQKTDMFNHSCNPNAGFKGQIFLEAMRSIKKGEQVTFDYAMVLHKSKESKSYKMKCLCREKKCRKFITDNDWKNKDIQKKYNGYFQYYLQEKINNLNK